MLGRGVPVKSCRSPPGDERVTELGDGRGPGKAGVGDVHAAGQARGVARHRERVLAVDEDRGRAEESDSLGLLGSIQVRRIIADSVIANQRPASPLVSKVSGALCRCPSGPTNEAGCTR